MWDSARPEPAQRDPAPGRDPGAGSRAAPGGHLPGATARASSLLGLQRSAGNAAVSRLVAVQRQHPPGGEASEGDPALVAQLDSELEVVERDALQDDDLYLRAYANRARLLLAHRAHPPFTTQAQVDDFIGSAHQLATTELDTLGALGSYAELGLATTPQGFPLTWSGRIHAALSLGVDTAAVLAEALARHAALHADARLLPPRLVDKGLPVPLAQLGALRQDFPLRLVHARLPAGNAVGDFARATARHAQFAFLASFAITWERTADQVAEAVADGSYVPRFHDYQHFVENKQQILRDLPARLRDRMAMSEEELRAIEHDAVGLADAALLTGVVSGLTGLLGIVGAWDQGSALFEEQLRIADGLVAAAGDGDRLAMAFRWMWDAGYVGAALAAALDGLVAQGGEILASLAVIVILQLIPGVNVAVDVYLAFQLGLDVLSQLTELGLALTEVTAARSMAALQRAAGRLATVLSAGGLQILTVLVTMGVARGASAIRGRAARIRAANPALTEEQAIQKAMREASAAERAPLEATRGLRDWERGLSRETRPILDTPGVRERLAGVSPRTRRVLTMCGSACLPPAHQLLAADLQRLDGVLARLEVPENHAGLREYFYRRRSGLVQAIDDLDRGVTSPAELSAFLDRAVVSSTTLPAGASLARDAQGRWVYRRPPGGRAGRPVEVVEYDIRPYGQHGRDYGTRSFFQSHHGVQGAWAAEVGVPGYRYGDAPGILLRDSRAGSPHEIVNARQNARAAGRQARTYAEERALMRQDLEAAGVPEPYVRAAEQANDAYFGRLYRAAESTATPVALRRWFGDWVP